MPPRITNSQRQVVLILLAQGFDRETIAARVGVTPGQVSAVAAHVKMGTYEQRRTHNTVVESAQPEVRERVRELLGWKRSVRPAAGRKLRQVSIAS
jgi:hypothetical protein